MILKPSPEMPEQAQ